MKHTQYYCNIVCDASGKPYLVIVTDGDLSHEIPVHNTPLNKVRNSLKNIYNPVEILVSIILPDDTASEDVH